MYANDVNTQQTQTAMHSGFHIRIDSRLMSFIMKPNHVLQSEAFTLHLYRETARLAHKL